MYNLQTVKIKYAYLYYNICIPTIYIVLIEIAIILDTNKRRHMLGLGVGVIHVPRNEYYTKSDLLSILNAYITYMNMMHILLSYTAVPHISIKHYAAS